jgi:hypothetical protein
MKLWTYDSVYRRPGILVLVNDVDWELMVSYYHFIKHKSPPPDI